MPNKQKVRNWKEYNKSLKKRGGIIFTFAEDYKESLYYEGKQERGGKREYSKKMFEYILTIKIMFRLSWRVTIGFAKGLLGASFGEDMMVPDYTHASRECSKLKLNIKPIGEMVGGMEIAFDSTGVNVYGTSGWHQRKYGKEALCKKREQWKKIHIAIDLDSMQVLSAVYTDSNVNDCEVVKELCNDIKGKVNSVRADGAYDTEEFRKIIYEWGAKDLIPPATTSKMQDELKNKPKKKKEYLMVRDEMIKEIRGYDNFAEGLKAWKINSGYHKRSKIESFMCRLKRILGFHLQLKTSNGRRNEIITKMNILNIMASFGRAEYSG
jgi:hypothetical protein